MGVLDHCLLPVVNIGIDILDIIFVLYWTSSEICNGTLLGSGGDLLVCASGPCFAVQELAMKPELAAINPIADLPRLKRDVLVIVPGVVAGEDQSPIGNP